MTPSGFHLSTTQLLQRGGINSALRKDLPRDRGSRVSACLTDNRLTDN
ncbi:hypothetical protein [Puniceicoccus vermicola]|uniref:Uncharacterized protein n=1 Tax=Puniceicoccus vermicola TaxID=388746 RepID=A0A7X1E615_9BACT|nr:hypothetical protein [Puniceicoccus vermicola]MBC2604220.1 hypothetical protein [Puniceicoccus vermicola]